MPEVGDGTLSHGSCALRFLGSYLPSVAAVVGWFDAWLYSSSGQSKGMQARCGQILSLPLLDLGAVSCPDKENELPQSTKARLKRMGFPMQQ